MWGDLLAIVQHSPRSSALKRAMSPQEYEWNLTNQLLAVIADVLQGANYQRGGGKGKRPEPIRSPWKHIPRPGFEKAKEEASRTATPVSTEEVDKWLSNIEKT